MSKETYELTTNREHYLCLESEQRECPPWGAGENNESAWVRISESLLALMKWTNNLDSII